MFRACVRAAGREITRAVFEKHLVTKLPLRALTADVVLLLAPGTAIDARRMS